MSDDVDASPETDPGTTGGNEPSWREQYLASDEFAELREDATLADIKDVPNLAKALVHTKALVGRKGVILPKEDATPEELAKFYTELGRPETAEAYELKPDGLPDDFPYSPELEGAFRKLAFEAGLPPKAAKIIFDGYNKAVLEMDQKAKVALKVQVEEMQAGLEKDWGPKYQENLNLARETAAKIAPAGSPEFQALNQAIGDSPVLVKFFYTLGKSMSEGAFITGAGIQSSDLETRRQELMRHPAYLDGKHVEHKSIVEQVKNIYNNLHDQQEDQ